MPIGEVVAQARTLVANGVKEVVLTGVDITAYGGDLPGEPSLGQLCRRLLALVPELPRLRSPRSTRSRSTRTCSA